MCISNATVKFHLAVLSYVDGLLSAESKTIE